MALPSFVNGSVETWPSYGERRLFGAIGWGVIAPVASIGLGWGLHTAVHAVLIVGAIAPALQLARQSPRRHRPRRPLGLHSQKKTKTKTKKCKCGEVNCPAQ
jgi:hypothetical protein